MTRLANSLLSRRDVEGRKQRKMVTPRGKVLSLIRAKDEWLAVIVQLSTERDLPVLSVIVPINQLRGSARRKADRWVKYLS